jgi:hypothetical protein
MRIWWAAAATAICLGCGSSDDTSMPDATTPDLVTPCDGSILSLTMDLSRQKPGSNITVKLTAVRCGPAVGETIDLKATNGTAAPLKDNGDGTYSSTVTPAAASGEVPIVASGGGATVMKTAVVLPMVSDTWDQPEAVGGWVNTAGWEDSAAISADGNWLMLGVYSPVDLACCTTGCGMLADPKSTACQTSLGPYDMPGRPDFPGKKRITDGTHITNACPSLGIPPNGGETNQVIPPIAGYLFQRQPDDTFTNPSFVGFDADGCANPSGFSFADFPSDVGAHLVFSFNDPRAAAMGDFHNHLYWTPVAFSGSNSLGTFQYSMGSGVTCNVFVPILLTVGAPPDDAGNPSYFNSRIWFDDQALQEQDLYFADATGKLQLATWSTPKPTGCSMVGKAESEPFIDDLDLYFTRDGAIVRADLVANDKDPSDPASWTAATVELAPEAGSRVGAIGTVGHASIGRPTDGQWLYFNYIVQTQTGFDANVGRVRFR